jgi:hypothetical protein
MSKMALHDPFGYLKHKLWPKEGSGVKLAVWLPTTKSQESPRYPYIQVACNMPLESSRLGLKFFFWLYFNKKYAHKVVGIQSHGSPNFENFRTPTWES